MGKAVFRRRSQLNRCVQKIYNLEGKKKSKNYYVSESVGIACGFLILAIHNAGFVCLPHTPSPMGFLERYFRTAKKRKSLFAYSSRIPCKGHTSSKNHKEVISRNMYNKIRKKWH